MVYTRNNGTDYANDGSVCIMTMEQRGECDAVGKQSMSMIGMKYNGGGNRLLR